MKALYTAILALLAAATVTLTAVSAGEIHYSPVLDHNMAATPLGSSINWITGVIDDAAGQSGWNPFNFGPPDALYFLWPGNGAGMGSESTYAVLAPGTVVGPGAVFSRSVGPAATAAWRAGVDGYLGFKVACPAGTCYGYARLKSTAPSGFPLTLVRYAYHTGGAAITVNALPADGDPVIGVAPAAVSGTAAVGATTTQLLTIKNTGISSLAWTLAESPSNHPPPPASRRGVAMDESARIEALASAGDTPAVPCTTVADVPWLSATPTSGTIAVGSSSPVTVGLNPGGLSAGNYSANLCVTSNDTAHPLVVVPVSFTVTPAGGNGIVRSAPLNHAIIMAGTGTSLNIVSGALDDIGPIDANWDFNFFLYRGQLKLWKVDGGSTGHYALDASGKARLFQLGEPIGPGTAFSSGYGSVAMADDWLAGADGYLGVKFHCNGRLPFPVTGGVCYGYVHLKTTGPTGFPATILDTGFDGDGGAIMTPVASPNGIIRSGLLNHAIPQTVAGTSLNIVSSAFEDGGPLSGSWDFNFWKSTDGLGLFQPGGVNDGQYAVDASGKALLLQPGDTVGTGNTFTSGYRVVSLAAGWLAGADGYLGVKFNCNGRLTSPVMGGVCYGYVHLKTTGPTGFPATILNTVFDGDGHPIMIAPVDSPNGIIRSGPLNHAILMTYPGTSLNIVSGALDDDGPINADWDFNFFSNQGQLSLWRVASGSTGHYALDASGKARLFQLGESIGPGTAFSSGQGSVMVADGWLAGTDGYLGVKFNCNGRLPFPVAGVCYGYVHIKTTGPGGFPATILDTLFDGDGNAIVIQNPPPPPVANVTPAGGFDFTIDAGTTGTDTLVIGNIGGGTLTWSIAESAAARTNPPSYRNTPAAKYAVGAFDRSATLVSARSQGANGFGRPLVLDATMISQMTDNTPGDEGVSCGTQGVSTADNSWWRRFYFNEHPAVGATANIDSVTISTGSTTVSGGLPTTINLYTIAHSTAVNTIPTSGLTLIGTKTTTVNGSLASVTIPVTGTVSDTVGKDLVVEWHTDGTSSNQFFPGANASAQTHPSFLSSTTCGVSQPTSASNLGFPDFHLTMVVTLGGDGQGGCQNPRDIPWLSTNPSTGSVAGGASSNVAVKVDASTLTAGTYSASLCVTTNDPTHALITVPVSLRVAGGNEGIFCSGVEVGEDGTCDSPVPPAGDIVVSGPLNHAIQNTIDGTSVNWITGDIQDADVEKYHFNPYNNGVQLTFWWQTYAPEIASVAAHASASDFLVLQSGAVVGPASVWSTANNPGSAAWATTANGYLGFRFNCSSLPNPPALGICYGYVHMQTTAPTGFPATLLDYGYDRSGAAITIP